MTDWPKVSGSAHSPVKGAVIDHPFLLIMETSERFLRYPIRLSRSRCDELTMRSPRVSRPGGQRARHAMDDRQAAGRDTPAALGRGRKAQARHQRWQAS